MENPRICWKMDVADLTLFKKSVSDVSDLCCDVLASKQSAFIKLVSHQRKSFLAKRIYGIKNLQPVSVEDITNVKEQILKDGGDQYSVRKGHNEEGVQAALTALSAYGARDAVKKKSKFISYYNSQTPLTTTTHEVSFLIEHTMDVVHTRSCVLHFRHNLQDAERVGDVIDHVIVEFEDDTFTEDGPHRLWKNQVQRYHGFSIDHMNYVNDNVVKPQLDPLNSIVSIPLLLESIPYFTTTTQIKVKIVFKIQVNDVALYMRGSLLDSPERSKLKNVHSLHESGIMCGSKSFDSLLPDSSARLKLNLEDAVGGQSIIHHVVVEFESNSSAASQGTSDDVKSIRLQVNSHKFAQMPKFMSNVVVPQSHFGVKNVDTNILILPIEFSEDSQSSSAFDFNRIEKCPILCDVSPESKNKTFNVKVTFWYEGFFMQNDTNALIKRFVDNLEETKVLDEYLRKK